MVKIMLRMRPDLKRLKQIAALSCVVATSVGFIGGSSYEWSFAPKGDRAAVIANCRGDFADATSCKGVDLPSFATATTTAGIGVSTVIRMPR